MELPEPVQPMPMPNTSPTLATVMSKCFLRAAFANSEHSAYAFPWPQALLGSAAHQVFERVYKGEMTAHNESKAITQIRELWENALEEQRARILDNPIQQPFLSRFGEAQKWPGYSLRRARTVLRALSIWREVSAGASRYAANLIAAGAAEERLSAFDGRLRGRLDKVFTNRDGVHLIDYKTGSIYDERSEGERQAIKADYVNQLLIYAAMYHNERGVWPVSAILEPLLETAVRSALWRRGLRFRKNVPSLPGKPDIVFPGPKVVVFIDSCFWHGCPDHCRMPQSNKEYWERKIARNKQRDKEINQQYEQLEWTVLRVWEHKLKEDFEGTIDKIHNIVTALKHRGNR